MNYMANSIGQSLLNHSFAVGSLAKAILMKNIEDEKLGNLAFISGCMHDVGKIDDSFQDWVKKAHKKKIDSYVPEDGEHIQNKKFSFEKHPRHNEVSLVAASLLMNDDPTVMNKKNQKRLLHSIFWSHAKPIRKDELVNMASIVNKFCKKDKNIITEYVEKVREFISELNALYPSANLEKIFNNTEIKERTEDMRENALPDFKKYYESNESFEDYQKDIANNATNNLIRSSVISADRLISSISAKRLNTLIENKKFKEFFEETLFNDFNLKSHVDKCIEWFKKEYPNSKRNEKQNEASDALARYIDEISILNGAPGVGKTKTALEWAAKTGVKKLFWICPRVDVCLGMFEELSKKYLPNSKVEIATGEFKRTSINGIEYETTESFSGDVVITTIDQIIDSITTHKNITKFVDFMCSHVVFDEFHEYINMSAYNLFFSELIKSKKKAKTPNTLLVSATPNFCFSEDFLEIDPESIVTLESFNETEYQISPYFYDEDSTDEDNPFYKKSKDGVRQINICNMANTAQKSFIDNQYKENALLYHSKYIKQDKKKYFNEMFESFGENGSKKYDCLRSGPAVSASLNISCDYMLSDFNNFDNTMQRNGRLGRFGENEFCLMTIAIPNSIENGKKNGSCARFLNHLHLLNGALSFHKFAKEHLYDKKMKLKEINKLYKEFYQNKEYRSSVKEDILKSMKESVKNINKKLMDPIQTPKKFTSENTKVRIKNNSLRGDNRFVQMCVCYVEDRHSKDGIKIENEYCYKEEEIDSGLTLPTMKILGYGRSERNLLSFMMKKHHNIKDDFTKPHNDFALMSTAKDPETPIYVSYTPEDLEKVNADNHSFAIFYLKTNKQNVGAMSLPKLQE